MPIHARGSDGRGGLRRRLAGVVAVICLTAGALGGGALGAGAPALAATGWTGPTTIDTSHPPLAVSCPSRSFCATVGADGYAETFNGSDWSTPVDPDPNGKGLSAVSCVSSTFCAAVDNNGNAITFDGTAWSSPTAVDTTGNALGAVSCASVTLCVTGDAGGNAFVYNGSKWSGPFTVNNNPDEKSIYGMSCPSASFCVAAGQSGTIEQSTDGGKTWPESFAVASPNDLRSVSCRSSSFCVGVDIAGDAITYNGSAWNGPNVIDSGQALNSVSCPSSSFCVAIDGSENVLTFNGSSWSAPDSLGSGTKLTPSVSCPSPSFCVAVDGTGNAFTYGGMRSSPPASQVAPAVLGKSVEAMPMSGVVYMRIAGAGSVDAVARAANAPGPGFVRLTAAQQLPLGSEIDALNGSVKLISATGRGHQTQSGTFRGAIFKVSQAGTGANAGLITLSLVEGAFKGGPTYATCKRKSRDASSAAVSRRVLQLLHASAQGSARTAGRYGAARARGAVWSIADRCDGTLTRVFTDKVAVTDFVRHVTLTVHAGQSYLARAPTGR
jgi:hypothetical protein